MGSADFYREGMKAKETTSRYRVLQGELTAQYYRWDRLQRELERLLELYAVPETKK
jgi:hypothetical protein